MSGELINIVTSEVVSQVVELIQDDIYKIYLYGSYARGDYTSESDIDIMIVLSCDKDKVKSYRKQVSRLASRIALENDVEVSLLLRDKESFEVGQRLLPFYHNVTREGVTIYG